MDMKPEEKPLYETMARTAAIIIAPNNTHHVDIEENEYLHGYKTVHEGLPSISIEE